MARIYPYANFATLLDETLIECGHYNLTGSGFDDETGDPLHDAVFRNYQSIFKRAMSLAAWRFASDNHSLHYDGVELQYDGFVSRFSVPIAVGDYYCVWGLSLGEHAKPEDGFSLVAKETDNGYVVTNYKPRDDEDEDDILYGYFVRTVGIENCPVYFTDLYKNLLRQFIGYNLKDLDNIVSIAKKEFPALLQWAIQEDINRFGCNTQFVFPKITNVSRLW